ncbi:MAG: hypothetical protein DRP02_02230 [Candidatus Gerdarchaeota archaeon]|nr:MAG: hypothetical protein DRP02_02230 [Candidatus Gerdarchaeota archaeon]
MTNKSIVIDGIEYIPADEAIKVDAKKLKGMKYVIVRTYSAGVHAGYLEKKIGQNVILKNARRLWYWDGASTLSQLAMEGVSKPENCKFPCEVDTIELDQCIEVIDCKKKAQDSINLVKIWKQ